jgi:hypothetical protein
MQDDSRAETERAAHEVERAILKWGESTVAVLKLAAEHDRQRTADLEALAALLGVA